MSSAHPVPRNGHPLWTAGQEGIRVVRSEARMPRRTVRGLGTIAAPGSRASRPPHAGPLTGRTALAASPEGLVGRVVETCRQRFTSGTDARLVTGHRRHEYGTADDRLTCSRPITARDSDKGIQAARDVDSIVHGCRRRPRGGPAPRRIAQERWMSLCDARNVTVGFVLWCRSAAGRCRLRGKDAGVSSTAPDRGKRWPSAGHLHGGVRERITQLSPSHHAARMSLVIASKAAALGWNLSGSSARAVVSC